MRVFQPRARDLLRFQNGGADVETSEQSCQKYSKNPGVFCRLKHDETSSFRLNNTDFQFAGQQTQLPKNFRKHHFIVSGNIAKNSMTLRAALSGAFYGLPAILKTDKALRTRLRTQSPQASCSAVFLPAMYVVNWDI